MTINRRTLVGGATAAVVVAGAGYYFARKDGATAVSSTGTANEYDNGASDTEIKIGHTNP